MLTPHQRQKLEESLSYLKKEDRLLISGSAGTGKTFLCNELVKNLLPQKGFIYCTAPTNKAVSVLKSKISISGNLAFMSTHTALKMKRVIDENTGEISFEPIFSEKHPPLQDVAILIIDESSMINTLLLKYIEEWAVKQSCKVIFLGDEKQLFPVEEDNMPVFNMGYPKVTVTEIIRQKDNNPIIDLSFNLDLVKKKEDNLIKKWQEEGRLSPTFEGYVFSNNFDKIIDRLILSNGSDLYKYVGYTNEEINKINSIVRNRLYGDNPKKIEIGETMIFDAPYDKKYNTNDILKIKKYKIVETTIKDPSAKTILFKYYLVNYKDLGNDEDTINGIKIVHEDSDEDFKKIKKALKDKAKKGVISWLLYYNEIEQFAQLKYNHAMTCHKMQGSTVENVILNLFDFKKCKKKEYKNLLYTGLTRASKMAVLYNA